MTEPWLDKRQIAAHLGVSPRTVTRLKLPHMRVGGMNRFRVSEVEAYLRGVPEEDDNVIVLYPRPPRKVA